VKGVLPATDAVASSSRETRVVGTRTEKLCQSAEIVFHVGRRTRGTMVARRETGWPPRNARRRPLAAAAAPSNFPIGATPIYLRRCLMARSTTRILSLRPDEIIGTLRYAGYDRFSTVSERTLRQIERSTGDQRATRPPPSRNAGPAAFRPASRLCLRPSTDRIDFIRTAKGLRWTRRPTGAAISQISEIPILHREEATANEGARRVFARLVVIVAKRRNGARKIERRAFLSEEDRLAGANEIIFDRAGGRHRTWIARRYVDRLAGNFAESRRFPSTRN
jgi:hypothetical protein